MLVWQDYYVFKLNWSQVSLLVVDRVDICYLYFEGVTEHANGEQSAIEQEKTVSDDTIQVSILIS